MNRIHRRRLGCTGLAFAALIFVTGCGIGKSEAQQAADALNQGLQAHVAGNLDQAANAYNECLKREAANKLCLYNLGLIAQTEQRDVEAEKYYRMSLETDPAYAPSLFNLAIIRKNAGSVDEAAGLYRQVIDIQPDNAAAHLNLGLLLLEQGQTALANAELTTAIKLDPTVTSRIPSVTPTGGPSASPS